MFAKILSKIESHLPHQYKEIAEHFSYVFCLRIAQQIIALISFFFILKYIPQDVVGHYHFVLSMMSLMSITALPGMRKALLQAIARNQGGFFKIATRYCVLGAILGSLCLLAIAAYYYFFKDNSIMALAFLIASLLNPLTKGLMTWKSSYAGEERFKRLSIMDAGGLLITSLLLMLSVLYYTKDHIILLSIALIIPSLQNLLLTIFEYKKHYNAPINETDLTSYGVKSSCYNVLPIIAGEIDRLSIYSFISASELALYNVAMKIPEIFKTVIRNLSGVIMPKLSRIPNYSKSLEKYFTGFSLLLLAFILIFLFTVLDDIFYLITPEEYHGSLIYAQALLISFAIGNFGFLKSRYIYAHKNMDSTKRILISSNIIKILLTPLMVFFFQVWGAIIVIFIQRTFVSIYVNFIIRTHHTKTTEG